MYYVLTIVDVMVVMMVVSYRMYVCNGWMHHPRRPQRHAAWASALLCCGSESGRLAADEGDERCWFLSVSMDTTADS